MPEIVWFESRTRNQVYGELAELVEGTFLLRRQADKNLLHWFESNTLRQVLCEWMMMKYVIPFLAVFFVDIFYTRYLKAITESAALPASFWGAVVWLIGSLAVIEYTADHWLLIPACIGAFCGTWVGIKLRK